MYRLHEKVTISKCDPSGRLSLHAALQMMQDCSELWLDSKPAVRAAMDLLPNDVEVSALRVEYRTPAKSGDLLHPTLYTTPTTHLVHFTLRDTSSALVEFTRRP